LGWGGVVARWPPHQYGTTLTEGKDDMAVRAHRTFIIEVKARVGEEHRIG
jgi:hypothetical protein